MRRRSWSLHRRSALAASLLRRHGNRTFEQAFRRSNDALLVTDDRLVLDSNGAAQRLLGSDPEGLHGEPLESLFVAREASEAHTSLLGRLAKRSPTATSSRRGSPATTSRSPPA